MASGPGARLGDVVPEGDFVGRHEGKRFERDATQGDDERWIDECNLAAQEIAARADLGPPRRTVATVGRWRVAQNGVGNECAMQIDPSLGAVGPEVLPAPIAPQRDAVADATEVTGRLGKKQDRCRHRSVGGSDHCAPGCHVWTAAACHRTIDKLLEGGLRAHRGLLVDPECKNFALQAVVADFHAYGEHTKIREVAATLVDEHVAIRPVVVAFDLADHGLSTLGKRVRFPEFGEHGPDPSSI